MYNFLNRGTRFFYNQLQLLRVETQKWPKVKQLLSSAQAQIIPRLNKMKLKRTVQQATLLVDEY